MIGYIILLIVYLCIGLLGAHIHTEAHDEKFIFDKIRLGYIFLWPIILFKE